jgi:hypothetical protein
MVYVMSLEHAKYEFVKTTEYTQSGNDHFLTYIPSQWKYQTFHFIYHHVQVVMYDPAERADPLSLFLLYP